jgi:ABC-type glycerol-3-phosphate transport system substrate-binding protein
VPSYRGTYTETMTGAIAAFRAGQQPHILQVFEVGTGTMMAAEGAIYPIYQLMADHDVEFDPDAYLDTVVSYYTDPDGNMLSFPFNSSTPIMYYNKDVFEEAGLDPESPPETWAEAEEAARAIVESGAAPCGFTTSWQLGDARELLGLAQPAAGHARQRLRGLRHRVRLQQRACRPPLGQPGRLAGREPVPLGRPRPGPGCLPGLLRG